MEHDEQVSKAQASEAENDRPAPANDLSQKLDAVKLSDDKDVDTKAVVNDDKAGNKEDDATKPKYRRVTGLRLKANPVPASDGLRRFALRPTSEDAGRTLQSSGLVSKEIPQLFVSDQISEWRSFKLERTPAAMIELENDAVPFESMDHFLHMIYEAIADGPDGIICEDRYLIWSKVTRSIMNAEIIPARSDGTIPKAARFTHFVPSNLLIVKIPVDNHSSAGFYDLITKPIIEWAHHMAMDRELKLCANTRYVAKVKTSAVEGIDFDVPHPALEKIAATNPGIIDGFGSFNECDMGFRPFRTRPYKYDTPSVVIESNYGSDYSMLRYKACWWLQLMAGQVKAVILVNVDPSDQVVTMEMWRNEDVNGHPDESDNGYMPTRTQKIVVTKKEEFKGTKEAANAGHYHVDGLMYDCFLVDFADIFLKDPVADGESNEERQWNFGLSGERIAGEVADLWFADGILANDWVAGEGEGLPA